MTARTILRSSMLLSVALATAVSLAPTQAAEPTKADDYQNNLEEVIVTAQKREQSAIDVPGSVTALNAELLARGGAVRFEDYVAQIPGVSLTALSHGYTSVVIRGISTGISQATPATAYYIDEAPIGSVNAYAVGSTHTPDLDPFDLKRVEVLKGPQGTMYGAGAVGGLVHYVTVAPQPNGLAGAVALGGNSVSHGGSGHSVRAAVNVPLNDEMALRASAFTRTDAGYIDNASTSAKRINKARTDGGRLAWNWLFNPDWSLQVWGLTQHFRADGIDAEDLTAPGLIPVTKELQRTVNIAEIQDIKLNVGNITLRGNIGGFDLTSASTYQTFDTTTNVDQTPTFGALFALPPVFGGLGIPGLGAQTRQLVYTKRWSQELRARTKVLNDALEYEAGLFYTNEDSSNRLPPLFPFVIATGATFPFPIPIANAVINSKYKEISLFGNTTYSFTPKFELQVGLRSGHNKQHYEQDYKLALLTPRPVLIIQDESRSTTTYLVSARYKPNKSTSLYARVATGYRPGGPSALPPNIIVGGLQSFKPDTLTSYEVGVKAAFADGKASIEAAVFSTDWKDIQIQTSTQTAAGVFQYFVNGGKAKSRGAEATFSLVPVDHLTLRATAAFTDSKLTQDAPTVKGLNGDRMPFVPRWTGSLGIDYRWPDLNGWQPFVGANFSYIGDRTSNFTNNHPATIAATPRVPSYNTVGANAGVEYRGLQATLYGKNLGDSRGINFINNVGLFGNPYTAGVIQPRTIGLDLSYHW